MPAVSKAQAGKIAAMYQRGEISRATMEDFLKGVKVSKLPARKTPKGKRGRK